MIISESDRVGVVDFILPVDKRVTADLGPTMAAELVDYLFRDYLAEVEPGTPLRPYSSPVKVGWPAGYEPDDHYDCWQQWFALVVLAEGR